MQGIQRAILFQQFMATLTGLLLASGLLATAGSLDADFDGDSCDANGFITSYPGEYLRDRGNALVRQADGRLLVAGSTDNGSNLDFALTRFTTTGLLDTAFDGDSGSANGIVITNLGSGDDEAHALLQQADSKSVAVGRTHNGNDNDIAIVRYNADGSLDTTFDGDSGTGNGIVTLDIGGNDEVALAVRQQADGMLVVAGYTDTGTRLALFVVRLTTTGALDTGFDGDSGTGNGVVVIEAGDGDAMATALAVQADGKLLIAGYAQNAGTNDIVLARLNTNGTLDTTFDGDSGTANGLILTAIGSADDEAHALLIQGDGQIVVAGSTDTGSGLDVAVVRYDSDGLLDTAFDGDSGSGDGIVVIDAGGSVDSAHGLLQQADDKLVLAGVAGDGTLGDFALLRLHTDGVLDTAFDGDSGNGDGIVLTTVCSGAASAMDIALQADNKLVVAGYARTIRHDDVALLRFETDGKLDLLFDGSSNGNGIVLTPLDRTPSDAASAMLRQADGKLVVTGRTQRSGDDANLLVVRYLADGRFDVDFDGDRGNGDGVVVLPIDTTNEDGYAIAQQADGKLVIAGVTRGASDYDILVVRLNTDGTLDTDFDGDSGTGNGIVIIDATGNDDIARSIAVQADGKLVIGGFAESGSGKQPMLVRLQSDGALDVDFDGDSGTGNGIVLTAAGSSDAYTYSLVVQPDGKLVLGGFASNGSNNDFLLMRFNDDGTLDADFDGDSGTANGIMLTPVGSSHDFAYALLRQPDGKLLLGGARLSGSDNNFALVRYLDDGTLDTSFDSDGIVVTSMGSAIDAIQALALQYDGRILAGGLASNGTNNDFALARYLDDGTLDTEFDSDGIALVDSSANDLLAGMVSQPDGKLVIAGTNTTQQAVLLARVEGVLADDDLDGTPNPTDKFPNNAAAAVDDDNDGLPDSWNAGCDATCQSNSGLTLDAFPNDTDNDGSDNDNDAFPDNAAAAVDDDDDGFPDSWNGSCDATCQSNSGLTLDSFPNDTDNDSSDNNTDAFPDNAAAAVDDDNDGFPDSWNGSCDTTCQENSGLTLDPSPDDRDNDGYVDASDAFPNDASEWADSDNDGVGDNADPDDANDNYPPVVTAPADIDIDATGTLTAVNLGVGSATDAKDGALVPSPLTAGPFLSGMHIITWQATDAAGNVGSDTQVVRIYPSVEFIDSSDTIGEGAVANVGIRLSGPSPTYPIQIPVIVGTGTAGYPDDHNAVSGVATITSAADPADEGKFTFFARNDGLTGEPDETVVLELDGVTDRPYVGVSGSPQYYLQLGSVTQTTVTITELNVAPDVSIDIQQDSESTSVVFVNAETITVQAVIDDPNPLDTHTVLWYFDDVLISAYNDTAVLIDPTELTVLGEHTLRVVVTDSGTPAEQVEAETTVFVSTYGTRSSSGGGSLSLSLLALFMLVAYRRRAGMPSRKAFRH